MYAVIRQKLESAVSDEIFLPLQSVINGFVMRFIRVLITAGAEKYRPAVNMTFYNSALYIKASQTGSV